MKDRGAWSRASIQRDRERAEADARKATVRSAADASVIEDAKRVMARHDGMTMDVALSIARLRAGVGS